MKLIKKTSILLVFGVLLALQGCRANEKPALEKNPFGEVERTFPSIHQDPPEVVAQKMFELDKNEVVKIGPQVLRSWRDEKGILVLDMMTDQMRSKFGVIKESQKWDGKKVFKLAKNTPIVLVASTQQESMLEKAYRKLQSQGYQNLFVLEGGIEAWSKIYGKR